MQDRLKIYGWSQGLNYQFLPLQLLPSTAVAARRGFIEVVQYVNLNSAHLKEGQVSVFEVVALHLPLL